MNIKKLFAVLALSAIITSTLPSNLMSVPVYAASNYYTIQSGDTLWGISRKFSVTVTDLKLWNNLSSDTIYPGASLKVSPTHKVAAGETLWGISRLYGTTVDNLMKLNNLTSSTIYIGQELLIPSSITPAPAPQPAAPVVQTVNYRVVVGDNIWTLAQNHKTTVDTIMKSNMLVSSTLMPNQILTIPVNSTEIVKPVGITMMKARVSSSFGDIYTWENGMRLWTTGTKGILRDLATGKTFNVEYMGGSNHSDIVPLTQTDTNVMQSIYGTWSWGKIRPMILTFTKGGVNYQMAVSLTGMPHGVTNNYTNGMAGHCDLYFYNSMGHSNPVIDPTHQANVLKANGQ